jgi:hypothetical protein
MCSVRHLIEVLDELGKLSISSSACAKRSTPLVLWGRELIVIVGAIRELGAISSSDACEPACTGQARRPAPGSQTTRSRSCSDPSRSWSSDEPGRTGTPIELRAPQSATFSELNQKGRRTAPRNPKKTGGRKRSPSLVPKPAGCGTASEVHGQHAWGRSPGSKTPHPPLRRQSYYVFVTRQ